MYISNQWQDYTLIDATGGYRLEQWGDVVLARPDPQVIWHMSPEHPKWQAFDGKYVREGGGGRWKCCRPLKPWPISYRQLKFIIKPTDFKHTGLFPEQAVNWDRIDMLIKAHKKRIGNGRPVKLLNLFAYTGGATVAAAAAGAHVTHVDAAKGMVAQARQNAELSGLRDAPIRWIVDDCAKYVAREIKRGVRYDAIILDPPSYGRGPSGEVWKLEDSLYDFLIGCRPLLSENPCFVLLNTYTTGLSPSVMEAMLSAVFGAAGDCERGRTESGELGLPIASRNLILPAGASAWWQPRAVE